MAVKEVFNQDARTVDGHKLAFGEQVGTVDESAEPRVYTCSVPGGQLGAGHVRAGLMSGVFSTTKPQKPAPSGSKPATGGKGKK